MKPYKLELYFLYNINNLRWRRLIMIWLEVLQKEKLNVDEKRNMKHF